MQTKNVVCSAKNALSMSLRKNCPCSELFSPNAGKYGPE